MESACSKLARAVEHQRLPARRTREYLAADPFGFERWDNLGDPTADLVRMHWRLDVRQPPPRQWSVLLGDAAANLRDALAHAMWAAVHAHSGPPANPAQIEFPITPDPATFQKVAKKLQPLVAADVWDMVEQVQPFRAGQPAHAAPLEVLRWLSNVDKHRFMHAVDCTAIDFGPTLINAPDPLQVVEDWRYDGPAEHGRVLVRLKLRRPHGRITIEPMPVFAHLFTVQISDNPVEHRSLGSVMDVTKETVLGVIVATTHFLSEAMPDVDGFELGAQHEQYAAEFGGALAKVHEADGAVHRYPCRCPAADAPHRRATASQAAAGSVTASSAASWRMMPGRAR